MSSFKPRKVTRKIVTDRDLTMFVYVMMFYMLGRLSRIAAVEYQQILIGVFILVAVILSAVNYLEGSYHRKDVEE